MNIIVKSYGTGAFYCRPDTSWEREDKDLYLPDPGSGYLWTPVLFARISKAGKCIGRKFSGRYYDAVNYGILLYIKDMLIPGRPCAGPGPGAHFAAASCADHTSVLPFPMYDKVTLEDGTNIFSVSKDGKEIYSTSEGSYEIIEDALSQASGLISLRIGDILAVELREMSMLADFAARQNAPDPAAGTPGTSSTEISGTFCGNELFRFKMIKMSPRP